MRQLLLISLLVSTLFNSVVAQVPPNVVLTGRISDTYRENFKDYVFWKAKLMMEFTNRGPRPVILINPSLSFGTGQKELVFYFRAPFWKADAKESVGFTARAVPRVDEADSLLELAKLLDASSPPDNVVVTLKPGESLPFSSDLVLKQLYFHEVDQFGYKVNRWDGSMPDNSGQLYLGRHEKGFPLNFATSLTVKYEFDLSVLRENPNFLSELNKRWRDYGQIPLNGENMISFTSEPIPVYPIEWVTLVDPNIWHWEQPAEYDPNPVANFVH